MIVLCLYNFLCGHPWTSQKHRSKTWNSEQHLCLLLASTQGLTVSLGLTELGCGVTVPRQSQLGSVSKVQGFNREEKPCTPPGMGSVLPLHSRSLGISSLLPSSITAVSVTSLEVLAQSAGTKNAQTPGVHAQVANRAKPGLLPLNHCDLVAPREQAWPPFCKT